MAERPSPKDLLNSTGAWYLRVSLDEVAQDVTSQRENVQRWLANHGLNVKKIHQFEDSAGYTPRHSPETRPKFQKLMEAVRAGLVKWVIVDHQNRIVLQRRAR
jgi:DNA invertase Pin-like site-specific DNA recombinase